MHLYLYRYKRSLFAVLFCLLCTLMVQGLFLTPSAEAVWFNLNPQQISEAIEYGKAGRDTKMAEFSGEWTVSLGDKIGWATLYSPFHNLTYKARKAAVERRELAEEEVKKVLETADTLSFSVTVFSDSLYYTYQRLSYIKQGEKTVRSSYEFLPDLCENSDFFPESPAFVAACVYKFPVKDLDPSAQITLVVIKPTGDELHFPFDLSKMR